MSGTGLGPERAAALLAARSAALAARGGALSRPRESRAYLVCACGAERYGLPLAAVAAVLPARPATPVPGSPAALTGVVALAGAIVSVLDLARLLGTVPGDGAGTGHLVHLRGQEPAVALAVDRVVGVVEIDAGIAADASAVPSSRLGGEAVSGYAPPDPDAAEGAREGFSILDLPRLLHPVLP